MGGSWNLLQLYAAFLLHLPAAVAVAGHDGVDLRHSDARLLEDFVAALSLADRVVLSPIMGSREKNEWGIQSQDLGDKIPGCVCLPGFAEIADHVMENAREGDLASISQLP